jgi:hypothetical protein
MASEHSETNVRHPSSPRSAARAFSRCHDVLQPRRCAGCSRVSAETQHTFLINRYSLRHGHCGTARPPCAAQVAHRLRERRGGGTP